jgi:predicted transcriptional regulator of viral defense system
VKTIDFKLKSRIYGSGRGSAFTPNGFLDIGGRDAVDKILSRLVVKGIIRRLAWGLYDYPRQHPELGVLLPDIEKVAKALAGKDRIRLQPAGAYATNLLGLSEQVPARVVFLTDGPSRTVKMKISRQEIQVAPHHPEKYGSSRTIERLVDTGIAAFGQRSHHVGTR